MYEGQSEDGSPVAVKVIELEGRVRADRLLLREKEITDKQSMLIVGGHTIHELCLQEVTAYQE